MTAETSIEEGCNKRGKTELFLWSDDWSTSPMKTEKAGIVQPGEGSREPSST